MTDPVHPIDAGPGPADEDDDAEAQRRCELLAALLLAASAAVLVRGLVAAVVWERITRDAAPRPSAWEIVEFGATWSAVSGGVSGGGGLALVLLVLAYLLVMVIGPGERVGTLGARVLQGVVAVGALLALAGAIAVAAVVRTAGQLESLASPGPAGGSVGDADRVVSVLDRASTAAPVVIGLVVAAVLAWFAGHDLVTAPAEDPAPAGGGGWDGPHFPP